MTAPCPVSSASLLAAGGITLADAVYGTPNNTALEHYLTEVASCSV